MYRLNILFKVVTLICCINSSKTLRIRSWDKRPVQDTPTPPPMPAGMETFRPTVDELDGTILEPFKPVTCCNVRFNRTVPLVYCYQARRKDPTKIWMTAEVAMSLDPDKYDIFWGANRKEVLHNHANANLFSRLNLFSSFRKPKNLVLNPFNSTCFAIVTTENYKLELLIELINHRLQTQFIIGMFIFICAKSMATNQYFHYALGTVAGITLSVVIVLYFFISFLPLKKPAAVGVFLGGSGLLTYLASYLWNSFSYLLYQHVETIKWYILLSGVLSFMVTYKYGAPTNPRTITVLKWFYQFVGVVIVYTSTYNLPGLVLFLGIASFFYYVPIIQTIVRYFWYIIKWYWTTTILIFSLVLTKIHDIYISIKESIKKLWKPRAPRAPPLGRRFLTNDEYRLQGRRETYMALRRLQFHLAPYEHDHVQALNRLSAEGRRRTVQFLTGRNHVDVMAAAEHAAIYRPDEFTDDEDDY